jgi:hypothetical protein
MAVKIRPDNCANHGIRGGESLGQADHDVIAINVVTATSGATMGADDSVRCRLVRVQQTFGKFRLPGSGGHFVL